MKQTDFQNCAICRKGMMHSGQITFYRLRVDHMAINTGAVQRAHGLEMMMSGHTALAHALSPNEDMAEQVTTATVLVCQDCALMERHSVAEITERAD